MTLEKLLEGVKYTAATAPLDAEIPSLRIHSSEVCTGDVFFCMKGRDDDGNLHIKDITVPFVAVTETAPAADVPYVLVEDVRSAYALMSRNFFLRPDEGMKFVAVVGTNGKTSTAHYIASLLTQAGVNTGVIGTEGHYILGERVGSGLTTPDSFDFYGLLFAMRAKGVDTVVSEVSAHAIKLEKLHGIKADVAVLTNVTQDHLDYFGDFATYKEVKLSYFSPENVVKAVVNVDDPAGMELCKRLEGGEVKVLTYGLYNPADSFAVNVSPDMDGLRFVANLSDEIVEVKSPLYGEFNVYNLLAALTVAHELGVDGVTLSRTVRKVHSVKGRFSILRNDRGTVIIDYAHTPDGLAKLLRTARTLTKSRLICVFGCGGERDTTKRAVMGAIAANYSDYVVITSDNPRFENPEAIIDDIEQGVGRTEHKRIANRSEAVAHALSEMQEGDTVVIAGKGSEGYIEVKGKKIPYSDFDAAVRWGRVR